MINLNENNELNNVEASPVLQAFVQTAETAQGATFKDEFSKLLVDDMEDIASDEISTDFIPISDIEFDRFEIDTDKIENVDAMFFLKISNAAENPNLQINNETNVIDAANYKTMEVSKTLGDMILKASESNKALRLDFDNQVTVVLKVSKEGKIDASFIPQNKDVETYLKNNIDYLKIRFDEQSIAYSNISYKPYKQNRNNKRGEK